MRRISTTSDIEAALDALCEADPRLGEVRRRAGAVPLRLAPPGFRTLASIVVSQQVSRASADAIFGRLATLLDPLTPDAVLAADDEVFRRAGLSRPKQRAMLAAADAAARGGLDLEALAGLDAAPAIAAMTRVPGIGPWTAECYLLFSAGHPDVFPARDVALQAAVGHGLGLERRPAERALARLAESWAPHRAAAARLFWAYYREIRGREGAPPLQLAEKMRKS